MKDHLKEPSGGDVIIQVLGMKNLPWGNKITIEAEVRRE